MKLIIFETPLLQALNEGRPQFERKSGLRAAPDWPNPEFSEAIPFFLKCRVEDMESEKWSFLIVTKSDSTVIGEVGSKGPISEKGEVEVGYGIVPSHRRKGFAALAVGEFIRLAFQNEKIVAVIAECLATNVGSIRVLERSKFMRVGTKVSEEGNLLLWRLEKNFF